MVLVESSIDPFYNIGFKLCSYMNLPVIENRQYVKVKHVQIY